MAFLTIKATFPTQRVPTGSGSQVLEREMDGLADRFVELQRAAIPNNYPQTRQSVRVSARSPGQRTVTIGAAIRLIVKGSKEHDIYPGAGGVLAFKWHGRTVFTRHVHQKARPGHDVIQTAFDRLGADQTFADVALEMVRAEMGHG